MCFNAAQDGDHVVSDIIVIWGSHSFGLLPN